MPESEKVLIPNFGKAEFLGVVSDSDIVIVRLYVGDGDVIEFCTTPNELKEIGALFYAHGKMKLGEFEETEPPRSVQ